MTNIGIVQILAYILIVLPLAILLGNYIAAVFSGKKTFPDKILAPFESFVYKICGVDKNSQQNWKKYATSMLVFNFIGFAFIFAILKLQHLLPLNVADLPPLFSSLAFNTAMSYTTNSTWQAYGGESTMSYFTQMIALTSQSFLSAATGIALVIALIRGISSNGMGVLGNFYVDLTRSVLYILLPIAILGALLLSWQGVPQNLSDYTKAETLEGATQIIAQGPVASQVVIKHLGTTGGGFFGANSAHPYENPTPISSLIQIILMLLVPIALTSTYGKMVNDTRQGWTIFAAMGFLFIIGIAIALYFETQANPAFSSFGITENMEGKEVRFGVAASTFWSIATTSIANGSINSMHDSFMPINGLIELVNIMMGEVIFGGVGSGLYGMLIFVIVTVFLAGLMVGRTPEYMGKKIETREIKLAIISILVIPVGILGLGAISIMLPDGASSINASGAHGLTQMLYAHSSATGNNGSSFAGFNANTPYHNIILGIEMFMGRFLVIIPMLGIAGSLANKPITPPSAGTLPTHGFQFACLLVGVLIVNVLTFFPALVLGPGLEYLEMVR